jgi:hypothetical protein
VLLSVLPFENDKFFLLGNIVRKGISIVAVLTNLLHPLQPASANSGRYLARLLST